MNPMNATDGSTDLSATFLSFAPCRVGQHAIFNWLMKHLSKQGTVSFYNNV
jgi:hypothetical protein